MTAGVALLPHIEHILDAARIAPSWGNTQPWRFHVEGEAVSFFVDGEREPRYLPELARISLGCAVECAFVRAGRMGATVRFETPPRAGALATLVFSAPKRFPEPDKAVMRRATNRHAYDGRAVDEATRTWLLNSTQPLEGARAHWFGRERVRALGPILEEAETFYYGDPRLREQTVQSIRFDVRDREEVTHGVSVGSLELSAAERVTMDALRNTPQDRMAPTGAPQKMGARARRLIESSSGVLLVTRPADDPAASVAVGRLVLRAWLGLTRRDLVAHPMCAVQALEAVYGDEGSDSPELARVKAVIASFRAAFPSIPENAATAVLMRYGWAPAPTTPSRRRPLEESVAIVASPQ